LSNGCVRIEKPRELAEWLLRDEPAWPPDRIAKEMQRSSPLRVNLKAPVPVLLVYHTVTVAGDGELRVHPDLYGLDAALAERIGRR
jgi:murein L,D-transpeptidase YcbB/YkuD